MKKVVFIDIISNLFILLFMYTAIMKIVDHTRFEATIHESPLVQNLSAPISVVLPMTEILISIVLLLPTTKRIGLYGSTILMGLFTLYVGYMLYFNNHRPCACGGIIEIMTWHQHLYFNTTFTILGIIALYLDKKYKTGNQSQISSLYA